MKKSIYSLFIILIAAIISFNGCKKDESTPTEPGNGGNTGGNPSGQPIPNITGDEFGVLAAIQYGYTVPFVGSIDIAMGFASFGTNGDLDAGTVKINDSSLTKQTSGSSTYYTTLNPTNPTASLSNVRFDGTSHNWSVSGSANVPAFTASVASPRTYTIANPAANATVNKTSNLSVTWTGNLGGSDSMMCVISSGSSVYTSGVIPNNGTLTVDKSNFSAMSGAGLVQLVKFRYSIATVSSKRYVLIAEIVKSVNVTFQ